MDYILFALGLAVYIAAGLPVFKKAIRNIKHGVIFDENFLMCIASAGSICLGETGEAVMVMVLYRLGEYLQDKAVGKSRKAISDLMDIRPDYANLQKGDDFVKVDPGELVPGDIICIKPGERIPADGEVVSGSSRIDTAAITGEAMPEDAAEGSRLFSGTINLDGMLIVKVSAPADQSTAARILELVEDAAASRGKAERFITRFARYYTPAVCAAAVLLILIPPLFFDGIWADWIYRGLCFLVVSCPCALVISIPMGFFAGIGCASTKGILVKGGNYLEALTKTDTIVFDKTGTLTKGVFKVVAIHPEKMDSMRLLELAALAESFSDHPISRSLADEYGKKIDKSRVTEFTEIAGKGVKALVDGQTVVAGNFKMMEEYGIAYHDCEIPGTIVHIALNGAYEGHITISDEIKEDAAACIRGLRSEGLKKIVMLTGDKDASASHVSVQLGLDAYYADLLPQDKVRITEELMSELSDKRILAFVGDGINDAPVLTRSGLGIAMGGMGSAAAVEAADIVLMNDKPSDLVLARKIASKTMRIIYEDIYFSIGVKLAVLVLSALGISNMWLALFADVGVCMLAVLNSMRAMKA